MLSKVLILIFTCSIAAGTHHWEEDKHSAPQPYRFGYEVKDKEGAQYRHEEGDGHGSVKGSYGYTDEKGLYREVHYVADKNGFRAKVKTNEPGTSNQDSANVEYVSDAKHEDYHQDHHPVYHKVNIEPVYHKVHVAPISPVKHFDNYGSHHGFNSFSPIFGYSYKKDFPSKYRSSFSGLGSGFGQNFGKNIGGYHFSGLNHGGSLGSSSVGDFGSLGHLGGLNGLSGFSGLGNFEGFGDLDSFSHHDIDKIIEELKSKKHHGSIDGFSGLGGFGGFEGYNNDGIDRVIEELKNKKKYNFPSGHKSFNDNDFHISEFRNIGGNEYRRSS